ncbi:MAG: 50S ribosomal protein L24 [Phycisphaerales bacterium]
MARHIRKGDNVMITAGDDRGQTGVVTRVVTKTDRVFVQGPALSKTTKHLKPNRLNPQGGIVTLDRSYHMSNVSPVVDGKATRVRFVTKPDGSKVRVAVRGGKELGNVGPATKKK